MNDANDYFESIRLNYRPSEIKVLFVGESRPGGNTFFYTADSNLYQYMKEGFEFFCNRHFYCSAEFFKFLMSKGIYLDDLCLEPINYSSSAERNMFRNHYVESLAKRIKEYKPTAIVIVMKGIQKYVLKAIKYIDNEESVDHVYVTAFPACGQQGKFKIEIQSVLHGLKDSGCYSTTNNYCLKSAERRFFSYYKTRRKTWK